MKHNLILWAIAPFITIACFAAHNDQPQPSYGPAKLKNLAEKTVFVAIEDGTISPQEVVENTGSLLNPYEIARTVARGLGTGKISVQKAFQLPDNEQQLVTKALWFLLPKANRTIELFDPGLQEHLEKISVHDFFNLCPDNIFAESKEENVWDISFMGITDPSGIHLLAVNKDYGIDVNLSNNRITDIGKSLKGVGKLYELNLRNNQITGIGNSLKGVGELSILNLSGNPITRITLKEALALVKVGIDSAIWPWSDTDGNALKLDLNNICRYTVCTPEEVIIYNAIFSCADELAVPLFNYRPAGLTYEDAVKLFQSSDPGIIQRAYADLTQNQTTSSSSAASSEEQAQRGTKRTMRDDADEPDEYAKRQETGNYSDTDSSSSRSDDETSDYAGDATSSDETSSDEEFNPKLSEADIEAWLD